MSEGTAIEWADNTFNPWWGCAKVSPACDHCYAERDAGRFQPGRVLWGVEAERRTFGDKHWNDPVRWNARAAKAGRRESVFCSSMADVFDKNAPAGARERLWRLIAETPSLDWLLLTKRIGNARRMLPGPWLEPGGWPANVRLGATFCNQDEVNRDLPKLLALDVPNFASLEPLLGPIDLASVQRVSDDGEWTYIDNGLTGFRATKGGGFDGKALDWVIVGGESGPSARPMHPAWVRALRDQCAKTGTPFLFKQWGEWLPGENEAHPTAKEPDGSLRRIAHHQDGRWGATETRPTEANYVTLDEAGEMRRGPWDGRPNVTCWAERVGKRAAGRLLDGAEHNGFPT